MSERALPLIFADRVEVTADFYELLGFTRQSRNPPEGEPTYIGLRRGPTELAVVSADWPLTQIGLQPGPGPRFEMFVLVDDLDATLEQLADRRVSVLRAPTVMPWGERIAHVLDLHLALPHRGSRRVRGQRRFRDHRLRFAGERLRGVRQPVDRVVQLRERRRPQQQRDPGRRRVPVTTAPAALMKAIVLTRYGGPTCSSSKRWEAGTAPPDEQFGAHEYTPVFAGGIQANDD